MSNDLKEVLRIAYESGRRIMEIYLTAFQERTKGDRSPLTLADEQSHEAIVGELIRSFPGVRVLSEEGDIPTFEKRRHWDEFWLVDPLDGTKEFIKRNGEFTVNICLVKNRKPVMGVIVAPALGLAYSAEAGRAWKSYGEGDPRSIQCPRSIRVSPVGVQSRSHLDERTSEYLRKQNIEKTVSVGSSLKFCYVAEGKADIYARLAPIMEWDAGAGVAIARSSGAAVTTVDDEDILFNTLDLTIPTIITYAPVMGLHF